MIKNYLSKYQELPIITINELNESNKQYILYDELVIDYKGFQHPGSNQLLSDFSKKDIKAAYTNQIHSLNANLMLLNLSFGRISTKKGEGFRLWKQVQMDKMVAIHDKAIQKLDFSRGIIDQIKCLSPDQLQALVRIPKSYNNNKQIKFYDKEIKNLWFKDHFWFSTTVFTLILIYLVSYLCNQHQFFNQLKYFILFLLGMLKWTAIQYYFHRFQLHYDLSKADRQLGGHYLHHAFPNLKNKIALSVTKNFFYEILFFLGYRYILQFQVASALHFLLGLHFLMILYDCLHYYFHFGPELNIPILSSLKRNHLQHHYRNMDKNFGVTTTLWDRLFGTNK